MRTIISCLMLGMMACVGVAQPLPPQTTPSSQATVEGLLTKYAANQEGIGHVIIKSDAYTDIYHSTGRIPGKSYTRSRDELRYEGGARVNLRRKFWGSYYEGRPWAKPENPGYKTVLWDEQQAYCATGLAGTARDVFMEEPGSRGYTDFFLAYDFGGAPLLGFMANDPVRIDKLILSEPQKASVRGEPERVGDSDCYVIDAVTKWGKHTAWIDPTHGYNIARAEVKKAEGDLFFSDKVHGKNDSTQFEMTVTAYKQFGNLWIPVAVTVKSDARYGDYREVIERRAEFTDVQLNPDFDTLRSFMPDDIAEGARVCVEIGKPIQEWRNGKPVPYVKKDAPQRRR